MTAKTMGVTPPVDEHMQAILRAAGADPVMAARPDAEVLMALRLASALGRRLGLDEAAEAAVFHYLRRIDLLEQHLRGAQHPASTHLKTTGVERPAPWHEPHG